MKQKLMLVLAAMFVSLAAGSVYAAEGCKAVIVAKDHETTRADLANGRETSHSWLGRIAEIVAKNNGCAIVNTKAEANAVITATVGQFGSHTRTLGDYAEVVIHGRDENGAFKLIGEFSKHQRYKTEGFMYGLDRDATLEALDRKMQRKAEKFRFDLK